MKTQKLTAILAAIVVLTAATAKAEISNTRTASCLVKVTCDPAILPLSFETIEYLLHSSGVAGGAAAELGLPRDESHDFFSVEPLSSGTGPPGPKPSLIIPPRANLDDRPQPAARPPTRGPRPPRPASESIELEFERYSERPGKVMVPRKSQVARPRRRAMRTPDTGKIARRPQFQSSDAPLPPPSVAEQMLLFRLQVELPTDVKPIAEEFMNALINNLRLRLTEAFDAYRDELQDRLHQANFARDRAQDELANVVRSNETEADRATLKQLDEVVDLSELGFEMPFGEAIELLQDSVVPPLKLIVLWRDLQENTANIDRTTPINMDPISAIPLGKALELLLRSVSIRDAQLSYEIDRGVITVATAESLPNPERRLSQITLTDTPVEMLLDRRNDLFRNNQRLEMEIARQEARRSATEEQIGGINDAVGEKVESDPTAFEIQRLIDINARELERAREALDSGKRVTGIDEVTEKLARAKIDLAKRREELGNAAGGNRLRDLNVNLTDVMIDLAVSRAEFEVVGRQLAETEEQLKTASAFDPEISQIRLAQEELEIAERRLSELQVRRADLRPPTVTVLGGI